MYALTVNGVAPYADNFTAALEDDTPPHVQVTFPGESGVTEWRCTECGESTQDEPTDRDPGDNVDPDALCAVADCGKCEGTGEIDGPECGQCRGTGYGSHDWQGDAHTWVNSASISADDDRVTVAISVGDPRGAFTMTVERAHDGSLRLSVPSPDGSLPHMKLFPLGSPGYYTIGG